MQNVAMKMMMTVPGRMWMKKKKTMQREMISTLVVRIIIVWKFLRSMILSFATLHCPNISMSWSGNPRSVPPSKPRHPGNTCHD